MTTWTSRVTYCLNGPYKVTAMARRRLQSRGVRSNTERIVAVEGNGESLTAVQFESGTTLQVDALFIQSESLLLRSPWLDQLRTNVTRNPKGLFLATDFGDTHLGVLNAAEGVRAAQSVHQQLFVDSIR